MEKVFTPQFSWIYLGITALILLVVYFLLKFLLRLTQQTTLFKRNRFYLKSTMEWVLLIFEPLALFILAGIFVFINPVFHGFLIGLLLIPGFQHLRNYESGKIIQASKSLTLGKKLKSKGIQGIIARVGRLGLELQSDEGLHFVPYRQLLSQGYTLVSGQEIGSFHQVAITPKEGNTQTHHEKHLFNLLISSPYLDVNFKPEIGKNGEAIEARVLLKEESYFPHLIALIDEWGYKGAEAKLI